MQSSQQSTQTAVFAGKRCALLVAHPGHELVVHRFVEQIRPVVAVLTDGSGATGESRVRRTSEILDTIGATQATLYGRWTDQRCYAALLAGDRDFFIAIAEELASDLIARGIEVVVGDADEGWNPVHDVWRRIVNAAVHLAATRSGRDIANFDFLLFGSHAAAATTAGTGSIVLHLDERSYRRKLDAGMSYPELHAEVDAVMRGTTAGLVSSPELSSALDARLRLTAEAYRIEFLRPVVTAPPAPTRQDCVYELYGEMVVAAGRYRESIRHDAHVLPVEMALHEHELQETGTTRCASSSIVMT